jgi:hypothetical protein
MIPLSSRRRFLSGLGTATLATMMAGCSGEEPSIELVAEAEFTLTEGNLLREGVSPGLRSYPGSVDGFMFTKRRRYEKDVDTSAWPNSVERTPFEETNYEQKEVLVIIEAALTENGRMVVDNTRLAGDRIMYETRQTCGELPATKLQYVVHRWSQTGVGTVVQASPSVNCDLSPQTNVTEQ